MFRLCRKLLMENKPLIIGEGKMPEAAAFHDVREACSEWPELVLASHVANFFGEWIPRESIIYNLEPIYDGCRSFSLGYLNVLRQFPVVDYQKKNVEYLKNLGIDAVHMPYGYHESMERKKEVEKDIDVLFFGSINSRRMPILMRLLDSGLKFKMLHNCYGKELDDYIARSKIHINFHFCEEHPLEVVRLNYLLANNCFVISERGWDKEENEIYEPGLVFSEYRDIVDTCKYYLDRDYERAKIAIEGERIIKNRPQSEFIRQAKSQMGIH